MISKRIYKSHSTIHIYFIIYILFALPTSQVSSRCLSSILILNKKNSKNYTLSNNSNICENKSKSYIKTNNIRLKRILKKNDINNEIDNINPNDNKKSSSSDLEEDPGTYLLAWLFVFFMMGVYMIYKMKEYDEIKDKTDYVWKFLFFANNGTLIVSIFNLANFKNILVDSSPFIISIICFIIGCFYYFRKFFHYLLL